MKILVTGGAGKIGGYVLRELLAAGHDLTDFGRSTPLVAGVPYIKGDITDLTQIREACRGYDAIAHIAAVPGAGIGVSPELLMYVNVRGTFNVLEAAVREGVGQVVFASSNAAMNLQYHQRDTYPRYLPVDEDHPAEPRNEYSVSKLVNEITCKRYSEVYGLRTICLRINHNWYVDREGAEIAVRSGWNKDRKVTLDEQWAGYRRYLEEESRGQANLWAVADARDAAQAFRLALENDDVVHEVFQINGYDTCSTVETATLVAKYYPDVPLKKPLEGYATLVSYDKATSMLGYRPRYSWRDSDFSAWVKGNRERSG
jgi:nucleoside-diphosphate-sugar epimerase